LNKRAIVILLTAILLVAAGLEITNANYILPELPRITIEPDGTINPSTVPIHRNKNTYTFTDDIMEHVLIIRCSNLIIDGKGFTLQGRRYIGDVAIEIAPENYTIARRNITIKNLNIEKFIKGISAPYLTNSVITKNSINSTFALNFGPSCLSNKITDNTLNSFHPDYGAGILITGSDNTISGNYIANFRSGIEFYKGENNVVSNNVLINNTIIINHATNTILKGNQVSGVHSVSPSPIATPTNTTPTSTVSAGSEFPQPLVGFFTCITIVTVGMFSLLIWLKGHRKTAHKHQF
jgi:parallel beta-helix repeat protein